MATRGWDSRLIALLGLEPEGLKVVTFPETTPFLFRRLRPVWEYQPLTAEE